MKVGGRGTEGVRRDRKELVIVLQQRGYDANFGKTCLSKLRKDMKHEVHQHTYFEHILDAKASLDYGPPIKAVAVHVYQIQINRRANAFFIIFVISAIYSIVGVTYFSDAEPQRFGTFCRAFIAMFGITIGSVDWWFDIFPPVRFDGSINFWPCAFLISYVIIVNWIFFQVSIAVLLDNFLTASNEIKQSERLNVIRQNQYQKQVKNPLDPLLLQLAKDYMNDAGLSAILQDLFKVLDSDNSGGLTSQEFQAAIKKLDFSPRIFISDSDFIAMTKNGALCNQKGQLGPKEFEIVMREQILNYTQSRMSAASEFWNVSDQDFTELGTLKQILMEQLSIKRKQEELKQDLQIILGQALQTKPLYHGLTSDSSHHVVNRSWHIISDQVEKRIEQLKLEIMHIIHAGQENSEKCQSEATAPTLYNHSVRSVEGVEAPFEEHISTCIIAPTISKQQSHSNGSEQYTVCNQDLFGRIGKDKNSKRSAADQTNKKHVAEKPGKSRRQKVKTSGLYLDSWDAASQNRGLCPMSRGTELMCESDHTKQENSGVYNGCNFVSLAEKWSKSDQNVVSKGRRNDFDSSHIYRLSPLVSIDFDLPVTKTGSEDSEISEPVKSLQQLRIQPCVFHDAIFPPMNKDAAGEMIQQFDADKQLSSHSFGRESTKSTGFLLGEYSEAATVKGGGIISWADSGNICVSESALHYDFALAREVLSCKQELVD